MGSWAGEGHLGRADENEGKKKKARKKTKTQSAAMTPELELVII
jgi:hypothetical protein